MTKRITFALLLIAVGSIATVQAAVLPPTPETACPIEDGSPCYLIQGEITKGDVIRISEIADRALNAKTDIRPLFHLNSDGGDVDAAIAIAREFRRISAVVAVNDRCLSACVFLMAGAIQRIVSSNATVGIHRPYSPRTDERNYEAIQKEQSELRERVRIFLEEMNLPSALYDAMLRVPSSEIKILNEADLAKYGLNQDDPVKQEMDDAEDARRYGISKQELFTRKAQAKAKCGSLYWGRTLEFYSCWETVMKGSHQ